MVTREKQYQGDVRVNGTSGEPPSLKTYRSTTTGSRKITDPFKEYYRDDMTVNGKQESSVIFGKGLINSEY
jgi:hypothetical protein